MVVLYGDMNSLQKNSVLKKNKKAFLQKLLDFKLRKDIVIAFRDTEPGIFFDSLFSDRFYTENKIPLGYGEVSDNPLLLAKMIDYLNPKKSDRILEVGTGSGYSTAILSQLCREVISVEINEDLALTARNRLYSHDYENIRFYAGDATEADTPFEPVDAVIVYNACRKRPLLLISLLKKDGVIVFPMGPANKQQIIHLQNSPDKEAGSRFKTCYLDLGDFPHISGLYGYSVPDMGIDPDEFAAAHEEESDDENED